MSFSYSTALTTSRDKVRFFIGDTTVNSGPKPSGGNFTDQEIDAVVTMEGSWHKAAALLLRTLASLWMNEATTVKIGPYSVTYTDRAKMYEQKAAEVESKMASSIAGLISFHGTNSTGDEIGHMFGKTQWGAAPEDWTD